LYSHILASSRNEALCGEHVLNLAGANTERQSPEGSMRRRMAVTAYHCGPRKSEALFRANDVHNPLPLVSQSKICETEIFDVFLKRHALQPRVILLDKVGDILEVLP
jgi:hypothetical protein